MILDCYRTTFARQFDGTAAFMSYASPVLTAAPLTMACWFISNDAANNQGLISITNNGAANSGFFLQAAGNVAGDPIRAIANTAAAASTTGYTVGQWTHAAAVFATTTSRTAYINGGSKASETTSVTPSSLDQTDVGYRGSPTPVQFHNGLIAWPAIWNVDLTDSDIALLAMGRHPTRVKPESLVAFWDFRGQPTEFGLNATYPLTNSGSVPVNGPGFLRTRIQRSWLLGAGAQAGGGGVVRRKRRLLLLGVGR